ncbi:MAG TPA: hypothetical protein VND93_05880 [Myxococcales bacterium]|nr:hypothetical protein [Myxococcales bacterium]
MLAGVVTRQQAPAPAQPQKGGTAAPPAGDAFQPAPKNSVEGLRTQLANDPKALAALDTLQQRGKLSPNAEGNNRLLDQLARLSDKPELQSQVVKDLAHPGQIKQGEGNKFCAATASLSEMARQNPAGYARVAADLATTGSSKVHGGVTLQAQKDLDPSKMTSMSATQKLMAPAVEEYANGANYNVDSKGVSHATDGRKTDKTVAGTYSTGMEKMQQALMGHDWDSTYIKGGKQQDASVNSAESTIRQNLKAGEHPSVSHDGHWFNVTGFRATPDGGRMTLQDPLTGETKTVNARHFLNKAEAVTFDKTDTSKDKAKDPEKAMMAKPKHEKPGGGGSTTSSSNPVGDRC